MSLRRLSPYWDELWRWPLEWIQADEEWMALGNPSLPLEELEQVIEGRSPIPGHEDEGELSGYLLSRPSMEAFGDEVVPRDEKRAKAPEASGVYANALRERTKAREAADAYAEAFRLHGPLVAPFLNDPQDAGTFERVLLHLDRVSRVGGRNEAYAYQKGIEAAHALASVWREHGNAAQPYLRPDEAELFERVLRGLDQTSRTFEYMDQLRKDAGLVCSKDGEWQERAEGEGQGGRPRLWRNELIRRVHAFLESHDTVGVTRGIQSSPDPAVTVIVMILGRDFPNLTRSQVIDARKSLLP